MPELYTTGKGYEEIRRRGRRGESDGLKHHRVLAYAWGLLDGLDDPREVDHVVPIPWLNVEWNLDPVDHRDHGAVTRRRAAARRAGHQLTQLVGGGGLSES